MEIREHYYHSLDSTNNEAKKQAENHCLEGTVISAGRQTAGRGRRGHDWETPQDEAIATSMVLYPRVPLERLPGLTLLAAVAVRRAVSGLYGLEGQIKWPNDIVLKNKKICGILTEMSVKDQQAAYVVVGIGVNVHNRGFSEELADKATSIDLELPDGRKADCGALRRKIWEEFVSCYETFARDQNLEFIRKEYDRWLVNRDRTVRVLDPAGPWEGIARGIGSGGELLVETEEGLRPVDSGEVSVRGLYGYV